MFISSEQQAVAATFDQRPLNHTSTVPWHTVVYGPLGTGKSTIGVRAFVKWLMLNHSGRDAILAAKTQTVINVLLKQEIELFGNDLGVRFSLTGKEWKIPSAIGARPNTLFTAVFGDGENPARRIQGPNCVGAYVDEANNLQTSMRTEIDNRLRVPGCRAMWTLNPVLDEYWTDFVEPIQRGEVGGEVIFLRKGANPVIPLEWYEARAKKFPFQWQRNIYIEGIPDAPGDIIYAGVPVSWPEGNIREMPSDIVVRRFIVGIDWGGKTVTHALLIADTDQGYFIIDEWHWDHAMSGAMNDPMQADAILQKFTPTIFHFGFHPDSMAWVIDQTSVGLIQQFLDRGVLALSSRLPETHGIEKVGTLFYNKVLFVSNHCEELLKQIRSYKWKIPIAGEALKTIRPIKKNNHGPDALRYALEGVAVDVQSPEDRAKMFKQHRTQAVAA